MLLFTFSLQAQEEIDSLAAHYRKLGDHYKEVNKSDSALYAYRLAIAKLKGTDRAAKIERIKIFNQMGIELYKLGDREAQVAYTDSALAVLAWEEIPDEIRLSLLVNRTTGLSRMDQPEEEKKRYKKLLAEFADSNFHSLRAIANINLGKSYANAYFIDSANMDTAEIYFLDALKAAKADGDAALQKQVEIYLATLWTKHNPQEHDAVGMLERARNFYDSIEDTYRGAFARVQLATAYYFLDRDKEALSLIDSAMPFCLKHGYRDHYLSLVEIGRRIHKRLGHFEEALVFAENRMSMEDTLHREKLKADLAQLEARYRLKEKEQKLKLLEAENALQRKSQYLLLVLVLIFFILMVAAIWIWRNQRKLALYREEALQMELQTEQLQRSNLQMQLDQKKRQLLSHALQLSERNELLEQLKEDLQELDTQKSPAHTALQAKMSQMLETNLNADPLWADFKLKFEEVHPEFFAQLKAGYPDLSEKDFRLLAFARLGLSIKEVAALLHVEPASVKTARYRLKKKLNLPAEQDIEGFSSSL
ncbi:helix-turn-helix transcriptional regulator [Croceimicrobium sp.]|uniref:helix-turn-helix transcriptional regulator n=1 Tax=Croceimicrobium sp. TaxID=2828340 RepID=UPI003BA8E6C4